MNKAVACASRKGKYTPTIPLGGGAERLLGVLTPHQKKKKKKIPLQNSGKQKKVKLVLIIQTAKQQEEANTKDVNGRWVRSLVH
jgi:hypothetical protein